MPSRISHKFRSHLQTLEATICSLCVRNGNNIHVNLFASAGASACTMEFELHGAGLKMLRNKKER
jgi:hypothetical protein